MPREANLAGWIRTVEFIPIKVLTGTSLEEFVTDMVPGFRRTLVAASFVSNGDATTASGTRLFRVVKNASTVAASGTVTLALSDSSVNGLETAFTLSTTPSDRQWFDSDTLTIDSPAAGSSAIVLTGKIKLVWKTRAQQ